MNKQPIVNCVCTSWNVTDWEAVKRGNGHHHACKHYSVVESKDDLRQMSDEDFVRKVEPLGLVVFEYISKITRRICPHLDHEEIAMDLWCKCWVDRKMPTYTQVKNFCLDKLRKEKIEKKHRTTMLNFWHNKVVIAEEMPNDLLDKLIARANLTPTQQDAIHRRFYLNESSNPNDFDAATAKLQRAWKEYQDAERDGQE